MVNVHQLSYQFPPNPLPLTVDGNSHRRYVAVRSTIKQCPCEANNAVVLDGNNRSISASDHSVESIRVLHTLLPTHINQELANLIAVFLSCWSESSCHVR